jgi:hypothetical protein
VAKHPFLSDDWFTAVESLINENPPEPHGPEVLVNLIVVETPFGDCEFHMGSKDGKGGLGRGHEDGADVTLTTDYTTAKDVFVSGNPQAGMQAFMAGKVKVQGDMTKLMAAQASGSPAGGSGLSEQLQELTE